MHGKQLGHKAWQAPSIMTSSLIIRHDKQLKQLKQLSHKAPQAPQAAQVALNNKIAQTFEHNFLEVFNEANP